MSELLSSLDVVNKAFKKTMRGYDPAEVDEFLDRVAESIQVYVQRTKDYERTMEEQAEKIADYDTLKGSLHEALLMAQRAAEEKVANAAKVAGERVSDATAKADDILAEARLKADRMVRAAEDEVASFGGELQKLQQLRASAFEHVRAFSGALKKSVEDAESVGHLEIPDLALGVMKMKGEARRETRAQEAVHPAAEGGFPPDAPGEPKKMDLSDTLNALGIDPNLLNPEV